MQGRTIQRLCPTGVSNLIGKQFGTCIIIIKSRIGKLHSSIRKKVLGEPKEGKFVLGRGNQRGFLEKVAFKLDLEAERISGGRSERE